MRGCVFARRPRIARPRGATAGSCRRSPGVCVLAVLAAASGCLMALALARALTALRPVAAMFTTVGRHTLAIFLLHVSIQKALLGFIAVPSSTFTRVLA